MNPRILFHNALATGSSLSATNQDAAYPVSNLLDWRAARAFAFASTNTSSTITVTGCPANTKVDTLFIAGHNLSGASINPAGTGAVTVPNNKFWMKGFTEQTGTSFTVVISSAPSGFYCGVMVLGQALTIPLGAQPGWDIYGWQPNTNWSMSDTGMPLGSETFGIEREITISYPDPGFTTTELWAATTMPNMDTDFRAHARKNPFAFGWNLDTDPEGYLCLLQSVSAPFSYLSTRRSMELSFVVLSDQ